MELSFVECEAEGGREETGKRRGGRGVERLRRRGKRTIRGWANVGRLQWERKREAKIEGKSETLNFHIFTSVAGPLDVLWSLPSVDRTRSTT